MLPEDTLLEIFDFYRLDALEGSAGRPWNWHRLALVCRRWRHVISVSPRRLDLRILCERRRSIKNILGFWPTLPIAVRYDAHSESKRMSGTIMAALNHPDRLCDINLNVTSSMTGPVVRMVPKSPCQALERIQIRVKDATGPSILIHDTFLGGSAPHLREIELDGISFPFLEIRRVLSSADNLIKFHLSKIPHAAYFSPDDLVTGLSTLVHLKSLTVDFHSPASSPPFSTTRQPPQSTTLPSLESFYFHGTSEYLDDFVSRIDLPALRNFTIKFFNQIFFDLPQFGQLVPHLNALESPTHLRITHSAELVSILFLPDAGPASRRICSFETSCRRLDWQLSFVTQILGHLPPLLSRVVRVTVETNQGMPTGEDMDSTQWLELFQSFTHAKEVSVMEAQLVPSVAQALATEAMATGVLPELSFLYLHGSGSSNSPFLSSAVEQFVSMRRHSGRPVSINRMRKELF
jgi:hypothetical protein